MIDYLMHGAPAEDAEDTLGVDVIITPAAYDEEGGETMAAVLLAGPWYLTCEPSEDAAAAIVRDTGAMSVCNIADLVGCLISPNWAGAAGVPLFVTEPTPPTDADAAAYTAAIVSMMDAAAQARRYDNALSLATYTTSTIEDWAAEAQAFVGWRDQVWAYAYQQLALVQAGEREPPTVESFLAELPTIEWPP